MPMHPSMYYDGPPVGAPPMEPYGGTVMSMQPVDVVYDQRYYWREVESKPPEIYSQQYQQPPSLIQRISGLIKSQLPILQSIMMQVSSSTVPYEREREREREREHRRDRSRSRSRSR